MMDIPAVPMAGKLTEEELKRYLYILQEALQHNKNEMEKRLKALEGAGNG